MELNWVGMEEIKPLMDKIMADYPKHLLVGAAPFDLGHQFGFVLTNRRRFKATRIEIAGMTEPSLRACVARVVRELEEPAYGTT